MLRPPYGFTDHNMERWVEGPIICWPVDMLDCKDQNTEWIVQTITEGAAGGAIALMQDVYNTSVEAALKSVDILRA